MDAEYLSPFVDYWQEYFEKGWIPIPLPARQKASPPTGFTGRAGKMADRDDCEFWSSEKKYRRGNIAVRVGNPLSVLTQNGLVVGADGGEGVGVEGGEGGEVERKELGVVERKELEVIGIDVDDYKDKTGGEELIRLEADLGKLPETYISSARSDNVSGIRWFLVPTGLCFKGKASNSIDIVQKAHRYGVVWPSWNPDVGALYLWRFGGAVCGVPSVFSLPLLSDPWVDFLTSGRTPDDLGFGSDLDSPLPDLKVWLRENFTSAAEDMCLLMKERVAHHVSAIQNASSSHDELTKAHWSLLHTAVEGHSGIGVAKLEVEKVWVQEVSRRDKRALGLAKGEIARSFWGCVRKIKAKADGYREQGWQLFMDETCLDESYLDLEEDYSWFPMTEGKPVQVYERTDWGNGQHFRDLHKGFLYFVINGGGWLIWDGKRWREDPKQHISRSLFRRVKLRQIQYGRELKADKETKSAWIRFANNNGNLGAITKALECASGLSDVSIKLEQLNADRWALGTANGVIKWATRAEVAAGAEPLRLIENTRELLITRNTHVDYIPLSVQRSAQSAGGAEGAKLKAGFEAFGQFLETVQPEAKKRAYLQKLLGQCLLGVNPEKIAIIFYGPKDTGKTTFLELLLDSIGDYGAMRPPRIYSPKDLHPLLATALSERIIGTDELGDSHISSDLFKSITGGGTITVEMKGSNVPVSDIPQFTPIITTNTIPTVPSDDLAFKERLIVITFDQNVKGKSSDPYGFETKLHETCKEACLAWLVEGCVKAIAEGIRPFPDDIQIATTDFTSRLSDIGLFVEERLERVKGEFVRNEDMRSHFHAWAIENQMDVREYTPNMFSRRLQDHGFIRKQVRLSYNEEGISSFGPKGTRNSKSEKVWIDVKLVKNKRER